MKEELICSLWFSNCSALTILALFIIFQVTNHLQAVARDANIRVVPIVGGVAAQKQERLLKARPEVVVATPGRLWELMSGGEIHLVEVT